jgi:hypothetical protein
MNLEKFLEMSPKQASNSLRPRDEKSLDKARDTLKRKWQDPEVKAAHSQRLRAYWKGRDGSMKGRTGFANKTSRPVVTPMGVFGSGLEAGRALGINSVSVRYRILKGWAGYGYLGEEINDGSQFRKLSREKKALAKPKPKKEIDRRFSPVRTPLGDFDRLRAAAKALSVDSTTLRDRIKRGVPGYSYL